MSDGSTGGDGEHGDTRGDASVAAGTDGDSAGRPCPMCERPMYSRHCKYVCPEHGVVYDCADTFY
jgi:hypothetical protein